MQATAVLTPAPEGGYTAYNPETGTVSEGETIEEAVTNLREAVELYLEVFPVSAAGPTLLMTFTGRRAATSSCGVRMEDVLFPTIAR